MNNVAELIPPPDLDIRDEEQLAAEAIALVTGGLTVERIDSQIEMLRRVRDMVEDGALAPAICPELTNANPSSPHTVLLEVMGWLLAQIARRINQLPVRDQIEFARLFGIELRDATFATTTLEVSVTPPVNVAVTIPAGTQVATSGEDVMFETTEELVIPYGTPSGQVAARCTLAGAVTLSPATLTRMVDSVAWVQSVTNPDAVESGSAKETVAAALSRARNFQRRAERLVSARDIEDAILEEALSGNGVVRAFPFIKDGDFSQNFAGHTTVVVMTRTGNAVSSEVKQTIRTLLEQAVGNQFIYLKDPTFVDFNVEADVRLTGLTTQNTVLSAIRRNLGEFYSASAANFGRSIRRSEIIGIIEATGGVERIEPQPDGAILISPVADVVIDPWKIPRLVTVTINVV